MHCSIKQYDEKKEEFHQQKSHALFLLMYSFCFCLTVIDFHCIHVQIVVMSKSLKLTISLGQKMHEIKQRKQSQNVNVRTKNCALFEY